jgi:hypothetical protein
MLDSLDAMIKGSWSSRAASHIGVVIKDHERDIGSLRQIFGYDWVITHDALLPIRHESGEVTQTHIKTWWSTTGLPHIELVQAVKGTVWEPRDAPYIHHMGYWVSDLSAASKRLAGLGMKLQATVDDGTGVPKIFAYYQQHDGMRLEIADGSRAERLLEALRQRPVPSR